MRNTHGRMAHNGSVAENEGTPGFPEVLRMRLEALELIPPLTRAAEKLGITQGQLSKWLAGREVPRDERAEELAHLLGLPLETVLRLLYDARRRRRGEPAAVTHNSDGTLDLHVTRLEWALLVEAMRLLHDEETDPEEKVQLARLLQELEGVGSEIAPRTRRAVQRRARSTPEGT